MTEVDICNRALGRLGEQPILTVSDAGTAGRACQTHFAGTRDEVLRSHRWNFATTRVALTRLVPDPPFGWACAFGLPADFIRAAEVNGAEEGVGRPWTIEGNTLLTDEEEINLVYIFRETNVARWDSLFCEAVSLKLASKLATHLRGSASQVSDFVAEYDRLMAPLARRVDANEGRGRKPLLPFRSTFVASRYGGI